MLQSSSLGGVIGLLLALVLAAIVSVFGYAGTVAVHVAEHGLMVPPDLEAIYRQVGDRSGVPWAALAAWDAAEFKLVLPIRSPDEIFADRVRRELDRRRLNDQKWCEEHPADEERCPAPEPTLTPDEEVSVWEGAQAFWRSLRLSHIEAHAVALQPYVPDLLMNPYAVYRVFLGDSQAQQAEELFEGYQVLETLEEEHDEILVDVPVIPADWSPVPGFAWPAKGRITSRYGMRFSPIDGVYRLHAGIDLGLAAGTPIQASKAGQVVKATYDTVFGQVVVVDHGGGYQSLYAHNSRVYVTVGQSVGQGQVIAAAGSTGRSTGPHLHFEIHFKGAPVNPMLLLSR